MKKSWSWVMMAMLMLALGAWAAGPAPLKVKALKNNVNLRAKPIPTAEVVGQVSANDVLMSKSMDSEWVEIKPPTNVNLWVLGDYVKDGVIQSRQKVNVRSGPGINFAIVGQVAPGEKVEVRGPFTDWIKIAPPETCSLWVSRSLIEVVADQPSKPEPVKVEMAKVEPPKAEAAKPSPAKTPEEQPAAKPHPPKSAPKDQPAAAVVDQTKGTEASLGKPEPVAEPRDKPAVATNAPADLDLIPTLGQGQWKQYDGILRPRGVFARTPSRFRLVSYDKSGNGTTLCYVKGNNDQLATLINRPMIISGREYWVQRQRYPVLIPDRIVLK